MRKTKKLIASAVIAALFLCPAAGAYTPSNGAAPYHGIDLYHGDTDNGQANWPVIAQSQQFVYIKSDEGEHTSDFMFAANVAGANGTGIAWGPYHFLRMQGTGSATRQADYFWGRIRGRNYKLIPAVDCESYDGTNTSAEIRADIRAFVDEFTRLAGYKPVLYTYTAYANDNNLAPYFGDCKLWLADYRGYAGTSGFPAWDAWQYSECGTIQGIANHEVDLNYATQGIFIGSAQAQQSTPTIPTQPASQSPDYYHVNKLDAPINSCAGADFNVLDSGGNKVGNHTVSKGDPLVLIGINSTGLAEVEYPVWSKNAWYHGYIYNRESLLHNTGYNKWQNGRTNEPIYDSTGHRIGTIYPHEQATVLYKAGAQTAILYGTSKGPETKSGLVNYAG